MTSIWHSTALGSPGTPTQSRALLWVQWVSRWEEPLDVWAYVQALLPEVAGEGGRIPCTGLQKGKNKGEVVGQGLAGVVSPVLRACLY